LSGSRSINARGAFERRSWYFPIPGQIVQFVDMENCKFSANRKLLKLKTLADRKIGELHQLVNGVQRASREVGANIRSYISDCAFGCSGGLRPPSLQLMSLCIAQVGLAIFQRICPLEAVLIDLQ
jgi:hypothetical protein